MFRFTSSLDAAEEIQGTHQYIKASRSLGAVLQLSEYFDKYKDIESVFFFFLFSIVISRLLCYYNVYRPFAIPSAH